MAKIVGEALGLSQDALAWLPDACAIHDIGKLGIPDAVLNKPGTLTAAEWAAVQAHCTIGHEILRNAKHPLLDTAAKVALSHHEHFDGSGYPRGLAGARYRWRRGSWQYATPTTPCGKIALIVRASAMTPPCG
jgi:putative two-component system response regulator